MKASKIERVKARLEDPKWTKKKKAINKKIDRLTLAEDKAFDKLIVAIYEIERYSQAASIIRLLFRQRKLERELTRVKRSVGRL